MKSKLFAGLILASGLFVISQPVLAHHGFAGRYDEEHPITVTGTVVELQYMNPHSNVVFDVKDAKGNTVRWQAELAGASGLHRQDGWSKDTLKPGDKVTITGPQNRNGLGDMNLSHESKIVMADTGKVIHDSIRADQPASQAQPGGAGAPAAAY